MKYRVYYIAAAMLFAAACSTGNANNNPDEELKSYPVVPLVQKDTVLQQQYVADIQACKNVELHARVRGILERIHVDEGQEVKKGQLLFRISNEELDIELNKAGAALNRAAADARVAEVEAERVKLLVDKNIVSATELDLAEAKHNALLAQVEEARSARDNAGKRRSYTKVFAPFDGIIDRLPLKEGSLVAEGSLLTTISDIESVFAYFNLSEQEYLRLMKSGYSNDDGREIKLRLADGSLYSFSGKVEPAESEINENTGSIAFRARFPNPDRLLKHGASGKVLIDKVIHNAILVPQKAVFEIQNNSYVFLLDDGNVVRMSRFMPEQRFGAFYIVESGLDPRDKVVYEGVQELRDGDRISPAHTSL